MDWSSDENIKITYRLLRIKGYGPAKANKLFETTGEERI